MKKIVFLFAAMLYVLSLAAQTKNCSEVLSNDDFQLKMVGLKAQTAEAGKLEFAKKLLQGNCLLSSQVKLIATSFQNDLSKLDFAKLAYVVTFDKNNFYEVYDAFGYFSNVFKLHDFVLSQRGTTSQTQTTTQTFETKNNEQGLTFPIWAYPDAASYKGVKGCSSFIKDKEFDAIANTIFKKSADADKLKEAELAVKGNCLSTAQLMKIGSLIKVENDRLNILKKGFFHCYDVENYSKAADVSFVVAVNKKTLSDFITNSIAELTGNTSTKTSTPCEVINSDYQEIKVNIKKQNFNNTRIQTAKSILSSKKCFTSFQIKEIVALFDFEEARLEIAKFGYDYCIDTDNYNKVNESFEFDSSKTDLMNFLQQRKK